MKKKILVAAIGALVAGGAASVAQADVKVGGMAQAEVARIKGTSGSTTLFNGTAVNDNARGRIWVSADEDLGDGMKGIALFEFSADTTGVTAFDSASGAPNTREKWVGLASPFGTIKLGSVRSPYKYAGGVLWDAFVTTNLQARGNGGMFGGVYGQGNFFDSSVNYTSPKIGGATLGITYGLANTTNGTYQNPANTGTGDYTAAANRVGTANAGDYSMALDWSGMGLQAVLAQAHNNNSAPGIAYTNNTKVGLRYAVSGISLAGQYEIQKGSATTAANKPDANAYFISVSTNVGKITPVIQLGSMKKKSSGPGSALLGGSGPFGPTVGATDQGKVDYLALGAFYNFSKTFNIFAGYGQNKVKDTTAATELKNTVYTIGMRKIF